MSRGMKFKAFLLLVGDIIALYSALFAALVIRYGRNFYGPFVDAHALPFSVVFIIWITFFYVAGLYDLRRLRNNIDFLKTLTLTIFVNALLTITFFYLIPAFNIAPKTNLFLFVIIFALIENVWRQFFNRYTAGGEAPNKVLLIGGGQTTSHIYETLKTHPQFGYAIKVWLNKEVFDTEKEVLHNLVKEHQINLVLIPRHLKRNQILTKSFYELLASGVEIRDLIDFYELIFKKVPLRDIEETWLLEYVSGGQKFYEQLKRALELIAGVILGILLLPLELAIIFLVILTSPGPIIYRQVRVGKNGRLFTLYKFRTMRRDAEKHGAQWSNPNDNRVTPFGRFLRHTHLDELPQLVNILKDDITFVGPRPERPEFVEVLEDQIPYYSIRHLVTPGITGWAQINYHYGSSIEDAYEKLQYDIYYIKNRSLVLDVAIILKTIRSFIINQH